MAILILEKLIILWIYYRVFIYQIGSLMIKVAVLDDYQDAFSQIVDVEV